MILRAAFAIVFAFISFGALVPPVYAGNVLKAHPVKCLPKSYAAAERGLARTRAKWSEIITENEGSFWADINNASDYAHASTTGSSISARFTLGHVVGTQDSAPSALIDQIGH